MIGFEVATIHRYANVFGTIVDVASKAYLFFNTHMTESNELNSKKKCVR